MWRLHSCNVYSVRDIQFCCDIQLVRKSVWFVVPASSNTCDIYSVRDVNLLGRTSSYLVASTSSNASRHTCDVYTHIHPKTLIAMWIICLDPVSANSEKGRGSEWAVRVGQRLPSRFGQSGAARELNLVQIVVEAPAIRGGLPST